MYIYPGGKTRINCIRIMLNKPETIDAYIAGFPEDVQLLLDQVRTIIKKAAPGAEEKISYGIPTFTYHNNNLVHFSAFKKHIGLYPAPIEHEAFKALLSPYGSGKATVQFPLNKSIPVNIITKIVKYRLKKLDSKTDTAKKKITVRKTSGR